MQIDQRTIPPSVPGHLRTLPDLCDLPALLDIRERPWPELPVLSFSPRAYWGCSDTSTHYPTWLDRIIDRHSLRDGVDYIATLVEEEAYMALPAALCLPRPTTDAGKEAIRLLRQAIEAECPDATLEAFQAARDRPAPLDTRHRVNIPIGDSGLYRPLASISEIPGLLDFKRRPWPSGPTYCASARGLWSCTASRQDPDAWFADIVARLGLVEAVDYHGDNKLWHVRIDRIEGIMARYASVMARAVCGLARSAMRQIEAAHPVPAPMIRPEEPGVALSLAGPRPPLAADLAAPPAVDHGQAFSAKLADASPDESAISRTSAPTSDAASAQINPSIIDIDSDQYVDSAALAQAVGAAEPDFCDYEAMMPTITHPIGGKMTLCVYGRDLHKILEAGRNFTTWFNYYGEKCGLIENLDFAEVHGYSRVNPLGGRPSRNLVMTLEAAKHVGMVAGGRRGKQIHAYFVNSEQRYLASLIPATGPGPITHHAAAPSPPLDAFTETTPLTVLDYVILRGIPEAIAMARAAFWEVSLLRRLPGQDAAGVLTHPIRAAKLFRRPLLDSWWATARDDAFDAAILAVHHHP